MSSGYVGAMVNGLLSLFFLWVVLIVIQIVAMCFVILDECLFPFQSSDFVLLMILLHSILSILLSHRKSGFGIDKIKHQQFILINQNLIYFYIHRIIPF